MAEEGYEDLVRRYVVAAAPSFNAIDELDDLVVSLAQACERVGLKPDGYREFVAAVACHALIDAHARIAELETEREWWKQRATSIMREHDIHPECGWRCIGGGPEEPVAYRWECHEHGTVRYTEPIPPEVERGE